MKRQRQGGFLISKIHQLAGRIFTRMLKEHDIRINRAQGRLLFPLWRHGSMPIHELAARTGLSKSSLTTMLDRLEGAGHIRREPSTEDRRVILIALTEKDMAMQKLFAKVSQEMTEVFYENLSDKEMDRFERNLERILDNLARYEKTKGKDLE